MPFASPSESILLTCSSHSHVDVARPQWCAAVPWKSARMWIDWWLGWPITHHPVWMCSSTLPPSVPAGFFSFFAVFFGVFYVCIHTRFMRWTHELVLNVRHWEAKTWQRCRNEWQDCQLRDRSALRTRQLSAWHFNFVPVLYHSASRGLHGSTKDPFNLAQPEILVPWVYFKSRHMGYLDAN
jgi:hypothetical protein